MKEVMPMILRRSRGYKAFAWGYPDGHTMDWRGCNYHFMPIPHQPHRGWVTLKGAVASVLSQFPTLKTLELWARNAGDGSFLPDEEFAKRVETAIY